MRASRARAFWVVGRERGEIRPVELPGRAPGEVVVEALHGAISRGTELLVFRGQVPESEHARMRAPLQEGEFPWPVKYGYSTVGRVVEGPPELLERAVFCLHPHQERFVVPADAVHPVPAGVPPTRAVLAANMETALNGVWDARVSAGDRVVVVGAGVVGLLGAYLAAQHPGAEVEVVDVDERKAEAVEALGLSLRSPDEVEGGADVVLHASGRAEGLATALALAGREASVVELSWYGSRAVSVALGESFHSQRLRLISSQVGSLPPERRMRWDHRRRMALALRLLADPRLDALIAAPVAFADLPSVMSRLARPGDGTLCQRVDYT